MFYSPKSHLATCHMTRSHAKPVTPWSPSLAPLLIHHYLGPKLLADSMSANPLASFQALQDQDPGPFLIGLSLVALLAVISACDPSGVRRDFLCSRPTTRCHGVTVWSFESISGGEEPSAGRCWIYGQSRVPLTPVNLGRFGEAKVHPHVLGTYPCTRALRLPATGQTFRFQPNNWLSCCCDTCKSVSGGRGHPQDPAV